MVKSVKCVTAGCELEGQVFPVSTLFVARVASLNGPFKCPKCGESMKVVERYPTNKGPSGKTMPRTSSGSTVIKVGQRKVKKGIKVKTGRGTVGTRFKKPPTKAAPKKSPRKRGPSK
jgi:hypothetical protein